MKIFIRQFLPGVLISFGFTLTFAALAQEALPPPPPQAAEATAADVTPAVPSEPAVRRLDAAPTDPATVDATTAKPEAEKNAPRGKKKSSIRLGKMQAAGHGTDRISVGHDANLAAGDSADAVVAVIGSATSAGSVADSVVAVIGNARATGAVGDSVVAVLGSVYVDGKVGDAVVAVMGDVELGPKAEVGGDVVAIGGKITRAPTAIVRGKEQNVALPGEFGHIEGLHAWFRQCLLKARPLAFGPNLGWAWLVALTALGLYVFMALLFPRGAEKCLGTLETRPGYSILTALLSVLAAPVLIVLLAITGVGLFVVPFLVVGMLVASLFGKAVILGWMGRRITRLAGDGSLNHIALAVLLGGMLVLGLYLVPVVGFIVFNLLAWIGMGVVIYTLILGMKREKPVPVAAAAANVSPAEPPLVAGMAAGMAGAGAVAEDPVSSPFTAPVPPVATPPPMVSAATLPRAGFWIRTAALLIDLVLVAVVTSLAHLHRDGAFMMLLLAAYGAAMWRLRGTTIGGIVCGLKVVRIDNREIDWTTAIVRGLGCFLSLAVAGLGFIWVAFDDEKQSWHDKIAGTTVVRVPKGMSLV